MGTTIVFAFMQTIGMVNDHEIGCFRLAECMAENAKAETKSKNGLKKEIAIKVDPSGETKKPKTAKSKVVVKEEVKQEEVKVKEEKRGMKRVREDAAGAKGKTAPTKRARNGVK